MAEFQGDYFQPANRERALVRVDFFYRAIFWLIVLYWGLFFNGATAGLSKNSAQWLTVILLLILGYFRFSNLSELARRRNRPLREAIPVQPFDGVYHYWALVPFGFCLFVDYTTGSYTIYGGLIWLGLWGFGHAVFGAISKKSGFLLPPNVL